MHSARRDHQRRSCRADLARFLRESSEDIIRHWSHATRALSPLRRLSPRLRLDHLPALIENLAVIAEQRAPGGPEAEAAARHALVRLEQGVELSTVVHELSVLRDSVVELWERIEPTDLEPLRILNQVMNDAIEVSVERYLHARDQTLRALDAISSAALQARTLDELFEGLLDAFRMATPAAHTAAILLREDGVLRMRASFGLEPGRRHFSVNDEVSSEPPRGRRREGFAELVARAREPIHIPDALEHGIVAETPAAARVHALFGVPLLDGDRLVGVAHLGSHTAHELSESDRRLFISMTVRATMGISQHVARDLAQRRATELAASEHRFRATFANAPVGIAHISLYGAWLRVNARFCHIVGYGEQELRSWGFQEVTERGGLQVPEEAQAALLAGRLATYAEEMWFVRPDQRRVWLRVTASVVHEDPAWQPYYIAIIEDLTERRAIEEAGQQNEERARRMLARERAAHALAERALAELDALLAAAPAGVLIVDAQMRYVRVNEAIARLDGVPVEAHVGRTIHEVLGEGAAVVEPWFRRVLDAGEVVSDEIETPTFAERDTLQTLLVNFYPVRSASGEILGIGGIVMDLTERKAMENALRASEQRAQRSVRLREQVLATVSHDLKSPLSAIRTAATLVLEATSAAPDVRRYTELIDRSAGRMDRMISDLLDLGAIESGSLSLELQRHDAQAILATAWELHDVVASTRSITLTCSNALSETVIMCDRDRILQVLANLIGNALKFTPAGGHIEIEAHRERGEVVFSVSDSGPGIPPAQVDHLFEAYWTTARTVAQGSGLGLYISKGIVEAHGGQIGARNRQPHGAMFWFTIPIERP